MASKGGGGVGQRRYQAFLREAKRDGQTHKEAQHTYRYFKAALGHQPKRGEYKENKQLKEEAKMLPPPKRRGGKLIFEPERRRGGDRGREIGHQPPTGGADWWMDEGSMDAIDERDEDTGSDVAA